MPQVRLSTIEHNPHHVPSVSSNYKMDHKRRGLAIIFNHQKFNVRGLLPRLGTNKDRDRLSHILKNLGFKVKIKNDLDCESIQKIIQAVAKKDHTHHDCLVIAVLTHGELGMLHARDTDYKLRNLWHHFTDQNCPTLAGKPKLFFIQACRGDLCDSGITLMRTRYEKSSMFKMRNDQFDGTSALNSMPTHPDFLFALSTAAHYKSFRNTTNGSWFIQSLCDMMAEHATTEHILTWLTRTCQKVATEYESYKPEKEEEHEKKQIPNIHSTLTRLLVFKNNVKKKKNKYWCIQS